MNPAPSSSSKSLYVATTKGIFSPHEPDANFCFGPNSGAEAHHGSRPTTRLDRTDWMWKSPTEINAEFVLTGRVSMSLTSKTLARRPQKSILSEHPTPCT